MKFWVWNTGEGVYMFKEKPTAPSWSSGMSTNEWIHEEEFEMAFGIDFGRGGESFASLFGFTPRKNRWEFIEVSARRVSKP